MPFLVCQGLPPLQRTPSIFLIKKPGYSGQYTIHDYFNAWETNCFCRHLTSGEPERPFLGVAAASAITVIARLLLRPVTAAGGTFDLLGLHEKIRKVKLAFALFTYTANPGHRLHHLLPVWFFYFAAPPWTSSLTLSVALLNSLSPLPSAFLTEAGSTGPPGGSCFVPGRNKGRYREDCRDTRKSCACYTSMGM